MPHQPMGGGVPTDIMSGEPRRVKTQEELVAEAKMKEQQAIADTSLLLQELNSSPVLALLAQQYEKRLEILAQADPECQTLLKVFANMGFELNAPARARKQLRQRIGPELAQFLEDSEAAPA